MNDEKQIRVWEGGDETTPPNKAIIKELTAAPTTVTPETEAEEI